MVQFRINRIVIKKDGKTMLSRRSQDLTCDIDLYRKRLIEEHGSKDVMLNYSQISGEPVKSLYRKYFVTRAELKLHTGSSIKIIQIPLSVKTNDLDGLKLYLLKKHKASSVELLEYSLA